MRPTMKAIPASLHPMLTAEALAEMYAHARRDYPNECCGIVFGPKDGRDASRAVACANIQNELHAEDPVKHARDARTAYNLGAGDLFKLQKSLRGARAGEDRLPLARRRRRLLQRHRSGGGADGRRAEPIPSSTSSSTCGPTAPAAAAQFAWDDAAAQVRRSRPVPPTADRMSTVASDADT